MSPVLLAEDDVIWSCGDPWCDLRPAVEGGKVTALTVSGALVQIDQSAGTYVRWSSQNALQHDGIHLLFEYVERATPCGLRIVGNHRDDWYESSRLVVLLSGLHGFDHPAMLPAMRTFVRLGWGNDGHPEGRCAATDCRPPT